MNPPSRLAVSPAAPGYLRRFPIGAEVVPGGGVNFRVWAPAASVVRLKAASDPQLRREVFEVELEPEDHGYFAGFVPRIGPGTCYKFQLPDGCYPDPASRFQPEGPHGASQVIDPASFPWKDEEWSGIPRAGQVLYEMHIGTFTSEGTWRAATERLPELVELGVTVLELMPVAEFPGEFGWGYDGVDLFAPTRLYGTPDDFRVFVDRAHALGLGVILDVVYNHFGPDGNFLKHFSKDYFTERYKNEWGEAVNFDGEGSSPVREFVTANAAYWIQEFHLDGLRLDATQQMFDASPNHILGVISRTVKGAARNRRLYLVGENETQQSKLLRPFHEGGYGMDALWNDDFHHCAMVALTGRNEAYYSDYTGTPQEFVSATKYGYLYQGQWYQWQKKTRGSSTSGVAPEQFINYLQNHDQVANSLAGERLHRLASPGRVRAMTALLLLGPGTPMLFQGQEFGASAPFLYFADHHPELAKLVAAGRREFLRQFPSLACPESDSFIGNAGEESFQRSKLDWSERARNGQFYRLHRDLLKLRREDPVFSRPQPHGLDGAVLGPEAFVLRFFSESHQDRLLLVNLGLDLRLVPAPEPLLAAPAARDWKVKWSSEDIRYGGCGTPALHTAGNWRVLGQAAVVLEPTPVETSRGNQ